MPSPEPDRLRRSRAARTTRAICVMGNSLALYNPPTRVAEEFAMLDVHLGRAARSPASRSARRWTPASPTARTRAMLRERYHEAHDLMHAGLDGAGDRSPSTAASTSSATSTSGRARCSSRTRRSGSRAAARSRPGSGAPRWTTSTAYLSYFGYKAGQATMDGFWDEMERLGKDRNPYRAGFLQFVGVAESARARRWSSTASRPSTSTTAACTSTPRCADAARLHERGDAARAACSAQVRRPRRTALERTQERVRGTPTHRGDRRQGLRDHRQPGRGGRAAPRGGDRRSTSATSCCCSSSATWART